ncbi:MAG: RNA-guided pseudouridylation complex pseudouridine synthase subunit Cbf5 [Nanoarchaeota archaeon]
MPEVLIRKESETDPCQGHDPHKRPMEVLLRNGIVIIDKPSGPTSHQVADYAKKIVGVSKAGHAGTLDPKVVGVLPVAIDCATRIVQTLLPAGKGYVGIMHLHDDVSEEALAQAIKKFTGTITQMPPLRSAVKRQERERKIYSFKMLERKGKDVLFEVQCQAGTYIRKLCFDIGKHLGCGAHMLELRRIRAGPFSEGQAITLNDLADAMHYWKEGDETYLRKIILPVEDALESIAKIWVFDATVDAICHGARLAIPGISKLTKDIKKGELVAIMTLKGELIALGESRLDAKDMLGDHGIAVKTHKVFMEPGTYRKHVQESTGH